MADEDQDIAGADGATDNIDPDLATSATVEAAGSEATVEAVVAEPEAPVAPAWRAALDTGSEDELAEIERHPRIQGLLRRREQSVKDQAAAQQQRANDQRLAQLADVDDYVDRTLPWMQKAIEEAQDPLIMRRIHKEGVKGFALGIQIRAVNDYLEALHQMLPPEPMVSEATQQEYQQTRQKAIDGKGAGPLDLLRVTMKMVNEASVLQQQRQLEAGWKKDWDKRMADERKTAQLKANAEERRNGNGPTNISGSLPAGRATYAERLAKGEQIAPEEVDKLTADIIRSR